MNGDDFCIIDIEQLDESYTIGSDDKAVRIEAKTAAGICRAFSTFAQVIELDFDQLQAWSIPSAIHVKDGPRFPHRYGNCRQYPIICCETTQRPSN